MNITRYISRPKIWTEVLTIANNLPELASKQISVDFTKGRFESPSLTNRGFQLLGVRDASRLQRPMDVFKINPELPPALVAHQLARKTLQHLEAEATPAILKSPSGRKLDPRLAYNYQVEMDPKGNITIDKCEITFDFHFPSCVVSQGDFCPFFSLSILRMAALNETIYFFDNVSPKQEFVFTINPQQKTQSGSLILQISKVDIATRRVFSKFLENLKP